MLLHRLHAAGFAHGDVFARNLCVSTELPACGSGDGSFDSGIGLDVTDEGDLSGAAPLSCRLIDLSHAVQLEHHSEVEQRALIERDIFELSNVFEHLKQNLVPSRAALSFPL